MRILLLAVASLLSTCCPAAVTPDEARQWHEDLKYFHDHAAEVHKNLFHDITRAEFDSAIADLDTRVPTLSRDQIIVGVMRIVAMIKDGHTLVPFDGAAIGFHRLPIRLSSFPDGIYVVAASQKYADAVGGKLVKIGSATAREADDAVSAVTARDNPMTLRARVPYYMTYLEILDGLGFLTDPTHVPLTIEKNGHPISISLAVDPASDTPTARRSSSLPAGWIDARDPATPVPLLQKNPDDPYWFEYLKDQRILYLQYNMVQQKNDESVANFFQRAITFAETNPVDKFVLDLRRNGGGNNSLNLPIIHAFIRSSKFNQNGHLFTLIGRFTFSAAGNFVNEMRIHTNTLFVGEPSGFRPNMFGDNAPLVLPNSKVPIRLSTLWWQDNDPRDLREWQTPDLFVELTFDDYRHGRDPVLQIISDYRPEPPLVEQLHGLVDSGDFDAARKALDAYQLSPLHKFVAIESQMNDLGYAYLTGHDAEKAMQIFKLNVQANPASANAYDSLGEAYLSLGNRELAIQNYAKSLELNPKNQNARGILARFGR